MKRARRNLSKKGRWIIFLLIIVVPLLYFSKRFYKFINSVQQKNNFKKEILILEAENEILENRINDYRRGNLLEAKARDDLGMIKMGEKIYLIPENDLSD